MQWDNLEFNGFSTVKPWNGWKQEEKYNVSYQENVQKRTLLSLKKESLFIEGAFKLKSSKETLYIYVRMLGEQKALIYCNFSDKAEVLSTINDDLYKGWSITLENEGNHLDRTILTLASFDTVIFKN